MNSKLLGASDLSVTQSRGLPDCLAALNDISPDETAGATSPFCGAGFLKASLAAYHSDDDPTLVVARRGGAVVGMLPLVARPLTRLGLRVAEYGFPFNPNTIQNACLFMPEREIAEALLTSALEGKIETLILDHLLRAETSAALFVEASRAIGAGSDPLEEARALYFADISEGHEAYMASRSRNHRWQLKKTRRKADDAYEVKVTCYEGAAEVAQALDLWWDVEARSWQGQTQGAAMSDEDRSFHKTLLKTLPAEEVGRLWVVSFDETPVAALRMLDGRMASGRKTCVHTMHFDADHRKLAPGLLAFDAMVSHACASGYGEVDMHGTTDFFARWATGQRAHDSLRLYAPHLKGKLLQHARRAHRWMFSASEGETAA